jgi:vacuolar-type H+-ATPase subunit C/Vma6
VKPAWEDLDARAHGLASRLLGRAALEGLAAAGDAPALARALRQPDYLGGAVPERASAADLDRATRRTAAARLRLLYHRAGPRVGTLVVIFEDEDRRSLRALLRGAVAGVASEQRLSGLAPTPALPERALGLLAGLSAPGQVAAALVAWGNPYGPVLLPEAVGPRPDPYRMERALSQTFFRRARDGARRGGHVLVDHVATLIDVENVFAALSRADEGSTDADPDAFVEGGRYLTRDVLRAALAAGKGAVELLRSALRRTPLAAVPGGEGEGPGIEGRALRVLIRQAVRRAREAPLGPAPLLAYTLKLRAELMDLRSIIWGGALNVSPAETAGMLVSL